MSSIGEITTIASDSSGSGGPVSKSVTIPSGGGWALALCWGYQGSFASGDVKDGANSWGAPLIAHVDSRNSDRTAIFYKWFGSAGSVTVTLQPATVTYHCLHDIRIVAKSNAKFTVLAAVEGSSTSPTGSSSGTLLNGDNVVIGVMTHNIGDPTISAGTGYTIGAKQEFYSGPVQPGASVYKTTSTTTAEAPTFSLSSSVNWHVIGVVVTDPASIYEVRGGGGNGYVDNNATNTITLPFTVPSGQAIIAVVGGLYAYDMAASFISDSGGHTWTRKAFQSWDNVGAVGSRDASTAQCYIIATTNVTTVTVDFSSVSTDDPDAAHYYRWAVIVVENPDATNGFATATPVNAAQSNVTTVAPGSISPPTNNYLLVMSFCDRGHASSLEPVTWSSNVDANHYDGTENSAHQSGSWAWETGTSTSAQSPTCTLNAQSVGARSCAMVWNLAGGTPVGGGSVKQRRTLGPRVGSRGEQLAA